MAHRNKMIKLFSRSLMSFEAKITGFISIVLVVLLLSPLYLGGLINLMRSSATGTVSDAFLNELLTESNPSVMLQRAKDAGLIVESLIGDTGEVHTIKDPATDEVLLTQKLHELSVHELGDKIKEGAKEAFEINTAQAIVTAPSAFMKPGVTAVCEAGSGANVIISDGKILGITSLSNVIRVNIPAGVDSVLWNKINNALTVAVGNINSALNGYSGDKSNIPRFTVDNNVANPSVQIDFSHPTLLPLGPSTIARADYRKVGTGEKTSIIVNTDPQTAVKDMSSTALVNLLIHELGHTMGLGHTDKPSNIMQPDMADNEPAFNFNSVQIKALNDARSWSAKSSLSNCKLGIDKESNKVYGADIVLLINRNPFIYLTYDAYDHFGAGNTLSTNPDAFTLQAESFASYINLYKGLVDRLSNTPTQFAVVEPVAVRFSNEKFIYAVTIIVDNTDDGIDNPTPVTNNYATNVVNKFDQYVASGFSSNFETVKSALDSPADSNPQKYNLQQAEMPDYQIETAQKVLSILDSGRDDFPNIIVALPYMSLAYGYGDDGQLIEMIDGVLSVKDKNVKTDGGVFVSNGQTGPLDASYVAVLITTQRAQFPIYAESTGVGAYAPIYSDKGIDTLTEAVQKAIIDVNLPAVPPTITEITISSDGLTSVDNSNLFSAFSPNTAHAASIGQYTISVAASDPEGADKITRMNAIINRQGGSAGSYRGYFTWSKDDSPYVGGKDERSCTGGGKAAINPISIYGPSYVTLDSCSITSSGNAKTVTFKFHLNSTFTAPAINLVSGSAENDLGSLGWKTNLVNAKFDLVLADTVLPTVSITSPIAGSTITGTKNVTANATDNVGVAGVQFKLDGANLGAEDTASPYTVSWNTSTATAGTHILTAVARDQAGNTTTSAPITVVTDSILPKVSMTSPISGSTVTGTVNITATATDNVGVAGVQFMADFLTLVGAEDTVSPYTVSWNTTTATAGTHTLTAVARDQAGNTKASSPISVVVVVPDTIPPVVSITTPKNGMIMTTNILTVSATATDNVGVVGVQFKLDGVNYGTEDTASPYTKVSTMVKPGYHTLTAVARDAAGNTKTSAPITIRKF